MKSFLFGIFFLACFSIYAIDNYFLKVDEASAFLQEKVGRSPKLLIVLTAGIQGPLDMLEDKLEIRSSDIPHFPVARVLGHEGKLIFGKLDGVDIVLMKGRYHFYEGITPQEVVFPYFVLNKMGVKSVITMNAVGGIREDLNVGDVMLVSDHVNLLGDNALKGLAVNFVDKQFTDMTQAYDLDYQQIARSHANLLGLKLKQGIYAAVSGPNYETKAEIRMLRTIGIDFVGMSTVFEVITCRFLDMRVLAFSCITNLAADQYVGKISHEEVLAALKKMGPKLSDLVNACAREIIFKQ